MMKFIRPTGPPASIQYRSRLRAGSRSRLKVLAVVAGCLAAGVWVIAGMSGSAFAAGSEIEVLTQQGISASRAEQALAVQGRVAETKLIDNLITALGDNYAGVWFEPAAAKFHVGVTSNASRRAAQLVAAEVGMSGDVVETPVRSTWSALLDAQTRWNHKIARLLANAQAKTGIYVQRNAVKVTLSSSVPASKRAALMREAANESVNVLFTVEPRSQFRAEDQAVCKAGVFVSRAALCQPTIVSGVNLWIGRSLTCTAGPMLIEGNETYVLTAGHCFNGGREGMAERVTTEVASEYVGTLRLREIGSEVTWWYNRGHDIAEIKVAARSEFRQAGSTPVPALMAEWGSRTPETPQAVQGVERVTAGMVVCDEGMVSGEPFNRGERVKCGRVESVNVTAPPGPQEHLVETNICGSLGDSGGPYFFRGTRNEILMIGTVKSGERPECTERPGPSISYFEPLEEIANERGTGTLTLFRGQSLLTRANQRRPPTTVLAEWLANGVALTSELLTETSGEFSLEDSKTALGKAKILCSGILDGWVGPSSLGWVSEILNLSGEAISTTPLTGLALECTSQEGCESSTKPKVWPVGLGWETEVELMVEESVFFALLSLPHASGANPGWEMECLVLGAAVVDECTSSEGVSELALEGTTLLDKLSGAFTELADVELMNCTQGGEASGVIEGELSVSLSSGEELTASSEGSVS
jgi:Trypsin